MPEHSWERRRPGAAIISHPIVSLAPGTRLATYEILSLLGSGGMGEVYRAKDTKLGRHVALKILPVTFTNDPDRLARFRREAQVLASLNHPHIAQIYGLDEANGTQFLVLELVDGESLDKRIARGKIPVEEALAIARQIAEALEAAHEKGIIHRDLKPANVALTIDGNVKVLDFGLAKAVETMGSSDAMNSPTITTPARMTGVGMILGTAAYMSPEQAKGKPADKRSDVWAFGCVLYEMLTGKRAFDGDDVGDVLVAVLRDEPDWTALPNNLSQPVHDLLRRCLAKLATKRLHDFATVRFLVDYDVPQAPQSGGRYLFGRYAVLAGLAVALIAVLAGVWWWRGGLPPPAKVVRFGIDVDSASQISFGSPFVDVAVSPDGAWIVYNTTPAEGATQNQLVLRAVGQTETTVVRGIVGTGTPFFSPDGQWLGFSAGGQLRKVRVPGGGPSTPICRIQGNLLGAAWGTDNTIVFSTLSGSQTGLLAVSADGGEPKTVTTLDSSQHEFRHMLPVVLPHGDILFTVMLSGNTNDGFIAAVDPRTGVRKVVLRGATQPQFLDSGFLVYQANGKLLATRFDAARLDLIGSAVTVAEGIATKNTGVAEFAVSREGTLVYVPGGFFTPGAGVVPLRTLVWVDRRGVEEPVPTPKRPYVYARLSPDGTRVALDIRDADSDVWIWDLVRRTLSRVTATPALETSPVWTTDGRRIIYGSGRAGPVNLFWQAADGTGAAEALSTSANNQVPTSMSKDGQQVIFYEAVPNRGPDLRALTLPPHAKESDVLATPFAETNADLSPDGRWIAYQSDESGTLQVYVRPYPRVNDARFQISSTGGHRPLWSRGTQELFYFSGQNELMAVSIETSGEKFQAGIPAKVLEAKYFSGASGAGARTYDAAPDGRRFLMIKDVAEDSGGRKPAPPTQQIVVAVNWIEELKAKVPTK